MGTGVLLSACGSGGGHKAARPPVESVQTEPVVAPVAPAAPSTDPSTEPSTEPATEPASPTTPAAPAAHPTTSAPPASVVVTPPPTTTTTAPPIDVAQVAAELARTEAVIRNPGASADDVAAAGRDQQLAYRAAAGHPEAAAALEAAVPAAVRPAVTSNLNAVFELGRMTGKLKDQPPAWRIVAPAPADELLSDYKQAGEAEGVPWQVLAGIHLVETRMGRIRGVSTAGAQGPMQFMPSTWNVYGNGGDIQDDRDAIFAAARLLSRNGVSRGDVRAAVYSYNHSQHYVNAVLAYADVIKADERAYLGYHAWQVFYKTTAGDVLLPEGYGS